MPSGKSSRKKKAADEVAKIQKNLLRAPIAAGTDVMLHLASAVQEVRTLPGGFKIFLPPGLNIEEHAVSSAIVVSVGERNDLGLRPGDHVAVSYFLAADHEWRKGHSSPVFNRCIFVGENQTQNRWLWRASIEMIMGVKRDGRWHGVGGCVFLEEIWQRPNIETSLLLPESAKNKLLRGFGSYVGGALYDERNEYPIDVPIGTPLLFKEAWRNTYHFEDNSKFVVLPYNLLSAYLHKMKTDTKPTITPLHDHLVVEPIDDKAGLSTVENTTEAGIIVKDKVTAGGVIITDAVKDIPVRGVVIAAGPGVKCQREADETIRPCKCMTVKAGDTIMFRKNVGYRVPFDGKELLIMRETDVLGIV